ncbi:MAG: DUF6516 family protein [Syntrophobacteraceae bacterium]|nr:DUF6516 family protein [Syntrophobacteraceae bacterium]
MLLDPLREYLDEMGSAVRNLPGAYAERYQEEIAAADRVNLRIRVRFRQGFLLELNEAIIAIGTTIRHLDYRYHFQDRQSQLVFRYDNTPHFPDLEKFPHHKHIDREVVGCEKPSIPQLFEEIRRHAN